MQRGSMRERAGNADDLHGTARATASIEFRQVVEAPALLAETLWHTVLEDRAHLEVILACGAERNIEGVTLSHSVVDIGKKRIGPGIAREKRREGGKPYKKGKRDRWNGGVGKEAWPPQAYESAET